MVSDWHPLVVWQERGFVSEQLAHIGRVVDTNVEVGLVPNFARNSELDGGLAYERRLKGSLAIAAKPQAVGQLIA
mgnify:CR=1 FL=1